MNNLNKRNHQLRVRILKLDKRGGGAPVAEGEEETELEGDCQETGLGKSGSECGDGLSVKRKILPNLQCTRI